MSKSETTIEVSNTLAERATEIANAIFYHNMDRDRRDILATMLTEFAHEIMCVATATAKLEISR